MIEILPANNQIKDNFGKDELGDILYGKKYLTLIDKTITEPTKHGLKILRLSHIDLNTKAALDILKIQFPFAEFEYVCPYTGFTHSMVVPLAVVSKNTGKYKPKNSRWLDWVFDFDYVWGGVDSLDEFIQPCDVEKILQGSGYTIGTLASDGCRERKFGAIALSNGDTLLVTYWVWYNK